MRAIEVKGGYVARVDDEDYDRLAGHKWRAVDDGRGHVYASRKTKVDGKWRTVYMHVEIHGAVAEGYVDHWDGDTLNNQRGNLRPATYSQNAANCRRRYDNTSGYRGVSFHKASRKWRAQIRHKRAKLHLGLYLTAEDAALAFDRKAEELFGAFARLNFPEQFERLAA